jgi:hypothetical protein
MVGDNSLSEDTDSVGISIVVLKFNAVLSKLQIVVDDEIK